jgi:hypothetical protein
LLDQDFKAKALNQIWTSVISYIKKLVEGALKTAFFKKAQKKSLMDHSEALNIQVKALERSLTTLKPCTIVSMKLIS